MSGATEPDREPSRKAPDPPARPRPRERRPLDASMGLLKVLTETALEPEYRTSARRPLTRRHWAVIVFLVAGLMFGIAAVQTTREAPSAEKERKDLIARAKAAEAENQELSTRLAGLRADVNRLSAQRAPLPASSQSALDGLEVSTGAVPVTGPGIVVTVDDADSLQVNAARSQVVDQDLRQLVNGLWTAGAEAVAINGHRITTRTAIRGAGTAITVDYVSLTRPYRVEAIGNPKTLPAQFSVTDGGRWWTYLDQNFAMRFEVTNAERLNLPAAPTLKLDKAGPP